MKGVYSSPDAVEENEVNKALFPDTPYRFESGGYPEEIPTLTQEMFLDFHKTYYSPQNSFIYLYGNMDIDAYLSYLDEAYLSHFDKDPDFSVKIPLQAPFDRTKEVTAYYPEAQGVDVDHKTYLSLNIVMDQALTRNRPWPLKSLQRSFLKAITPLAPCPPAGRSRQRCIRQLNASQLQPVLSIRISGSEESEKDRFIKVLYSTLQGLSPQGHPAGTYGSRTQQRRIQDARS